MILKVESKTHCHKCKYYISDYRCCLMFSNGVPEKCRHYQDMDYTPPKIQDGRYYPFVDRDTLIDELNN